MTQNGNFEFECSEYWEDNAFGNGEWEEIQRKQTMGCRQELTDQLEQLLLSLFALLVWNLWEKALDPKIIPRRVLVHWRDTILRGRKTSNYMVRDLYKIREPHTAGSAKCSQKGPLAASIAEISSDVHKQNAREFVWRPDPQNKLSLTSKMLEQITCQRLSKLQCDLDNQERYRRRNLSSCILVIRIFATSGTH